MLLVDRINEYLNEVKSPIKKPTIKNEIDKIVILVDKRGHFYSTKYIHDDKIVHSTDRFTTPQEIINYLELHGIDKKKISNLKDL